MSARAKAKTPVQDPGPASTPAISAGGSLPATSPGYPGSKGASGLAERIIRQMPPHIEYIEGFAGHAAVYRRKRRAGRSILIDADPKVCDWLREQTADQPGVEIVNASFLDWITAYRWSLTPSTLVYLDPPYLRDVRTRLLYDCEFHTKKDHRAFLDLCKSLPCMVMISHYYHLFYHNWLWDWRRVDIPAMTRGGKRIESLFCNFTEATILHDERFAGGDYRARENIARKRKRWAAKFAGMDQRERQAVAAALVASDRVAVEMALRTAPALLPAGINGGGIEP